MDYIKYIVLKSTVSLWPWNLGYGAFKVTGNDFIW